VAVFEDASYGGAYAFFEISASANKVPTDYYFEALDNRISSLIIFPKQTKGPLGVSLGGPAILILTGGVDLRFFPLPEMMNQTSVKYPVLGPEWDNSFDFGQISPEPKSSDLGGYVELSLYEEANFGGKSIALPWKAAADLYPLFPQETRIKAGKRQPELTLEEENGNAPTVPF